MNPLYERASFRDATADCLRPGGVALTERGLGLCGFHAGDRVADLGCGPGVTLALLASRGLRCFGMDMAAAMLHEAARRRASPLVAGRLEQLPLRDSCMDGLVCECVLSLSSGPEAALGDMARILRPGGRLLLSDITVQDGGEAAGAGQGCARGAVSPAVLRDRLERAGFRVVEYEDHSRLLAELAGRLLFQGVPRSALLDWMGGCPSGGGACGGRRLGYGMFIGERVLS